MVGWHHVLKDMLPLLSLFSRVRLCVTPQTAAHQTPLSMGFCRQEYLSGLPFPSPNEGHEFEQSPGVGDGQGSLMWCSPLGHKELDMTEQLNWTEIYVVVYIHMPICNELNSNY